MPGGVASSSATISSMPCEASTAVAYLCTRTQFSSSSWRASISWIQRLSLSWCAPWLPSISKASATEWAGSVEISIVRWPRPAHRTAVAAATEVFPTPPLPV